MVMTTVSSLHAQEETQNYLSRQQERQDRDLLSATRAQQAQAQFNNARANLQAAQPSMFGNLNNQNPLFPGGQTATIYGSAYPGFNPELARVNNAANKQIMDLVKKIKEAESDEVKLELKTEMKQILDEQYDEYLSHHEAPLKQLEERLNKLRDEFESRKQAKSDLVKLRLDTIWYDAIGLGWPNSQRAAGGYSAAWRQPESPFASPKLAPPSALTPRASIPTPGLPGLDPAGAPPRLNPAR